MGYAFNVDGLFSINGFSGLIYVGDMLRKERVGDFSKIVSSL